EAAASGIETVILVISGTKDLIAKHFQRDSHLERDLERKGSTSEVAAIRQLSTIADIRTVLQSQPRGLADAIAVAQSAVGDEPFAVILPDVLIDSETPATRQLMNCYSTHPGGMVATRLVAPQEVDRYGILTPFRWQDSCCSGRTLRVGTVTERPKRGTITSRYGILGRYILTPEIFACIKETLPGFGGELQLTDAVSRCSRTVPLHAYLVDGLHHDSGGLLGYLQAELAYGLKIPEFQGPLLKQLMSLSLFSSYRLGSASSPQQTPQHLQERPASYPSQYLKETIQI